MDNNKDKIRHLTSVHPLIRAIGGQANLEGLNYTEMLELMVLGLVESEKLKGETISFTQKRMQLLDNKAFKLNEETKQLLREGGWIK